MQNTPDFPFPDKIQFMGCDDVAETLDGITSSTARELWAYVGGGSRPAPLGGDGSNGTVEEPVIADDFTDGIKRVWPLLSGQAQDNITTAVNNAVAKGYL